MEEIYDASKLEKLEGSAVKIENTEKAAFFYCKEVSSAMKNLRECIDSLEVITAREYWPVPTYGEILFSVK